MPNSKDMDSTLYSLLTYLVFLPFHHPSLLTPFFFFKLTDRKCFFIACIYRKQVKASYFFLFVYISSEVIYLGFFSVVFLCKSVIWIGHVLGLDEKLNQECCFLSLDEFLPLLLLVCCVNWSKRTLCCIWFLWHPAYPDRLDDYFPVHFFTLQWGKLFSRHRCWSIILFK